MKKAQHVWTPVWHHLSGEDKCFHCGAARLQVRRVRGSKGIIELFWTPAGWVFARPKCVAKPSSASGRSGSPGDR